MSAEADIYSDLTEPSKSPKEDDTSFLDVVFMEQEESLHTLTPSSLINSQLKEEKKQKIRSILEENQRLRQENAILRRNISILFKTAQAEIERKDRELSRARH
jgi:regulator of replication initiation timing